MGLLKEVTNSIVATTQATKEALVAKPKKNAIILPLTQQNIAM